jgi:hypothetical protein
MDVTRAQYIQVHPSAPVIAILFGPEAPLTVFAPTPGGSRRP